jgi:hypothetical protein
MTLAYDDIRSEGDRTFNPVPLIFGEQGITTDVKLRPDELKELRRLVTEAWLSVLHQAAPEAAPQFEKVGIENYHQLSHLVDHARIWTTHARTLEAAHVDVIRSFSMFDMFDRVLPSYELSSAMPPYGDLGRPRVNWRLVRPGEGTDVAPVHADCWFYAVLDDWSNEPRPLVLLRIWIPIHTEEGVTGFAYVPGSHLRQYPFRRVPVGNGAYKPELNESELDQPLQTLVTPPGTTVMFNYSLVHRGANSRRATRTRVSMEMTLAIPRALFEARYGDMRHIPV